jgi:hypothetical protein
LDPVSDPVLDPDSNPDTNPDPKCLFRIRIRPKASDPYGSGSATLHKIGEIPEGTILDPQHGNKVACIEYKQKILKRSIYLPQKICPGLAFLNRTDSAPSFPFFLRHNGGVFRRRMSRRLVGGIVSAVGKPPAAQPAPGSLLTAAG